MSRAFWTAEEVCRALDGDPGAEDRGLAFDAISTDTRVLQRGSLFVALEGERFDAHDFLADAAAAGAAGAVVRRIPNGAPTGLRYFEVADTLVALGRLAHHWRRRLAARVVGVAGSNGKTTTKDLIRAALAPRYRVHATQGNLNNRIGLPLTLLAAPASAEVLVLEMGTDEPGEIETLARIAEPDAGVVTAIGEEHLEKLGSLEGVLHEETRLLAFLRSGGLGFVAEDPPALPERARELLGRERVRVAGLTPAADLSPDGGGAGIEILADGATRWAWRGRSVQLPLPGKHNVRNALLALGVAAEWGVSADEAIRGVGALQPPKLRGEWRQIGRLRVLADCYNSNPPSLAAAIELIASLPANGPKLAVVGTMRELGTQSDALHAQAAESIAGRVGSGLDRVVATGEFVRAFEPLAPELGDRLIAREDPLEAYAAVAGTLIGAETILLKASRGVELERWIPLIERDWGATT